jgi:hypothetical protein
LNPMFYVHLPTPRCDAAVSSSRRDIFGDTKLHEQEETSSGKRGSKKGNHTKNGKSVNTVPIVPGTDTSSFWHPLCVTQMAYIHFPFLNDGINNLKETTYRNRLRPRNSLSQQNISFFFSFFGLLLFSCRLSYCSFVFQFFPFTFQRLGDVGRRGGYMQRRSDYEMGLLNTYTMSSQQRPSTK